MFANEGVILSDSDSIERGKAIEYRIMQIARTPDEAQAIADYIASIDWEQAFENRARAKQKMIDDAIKNGGGYCDGCHQLIDYPFIVDPFDKMKGKYCYGCVEKHQKEYIKTDYWFRTCDECRKPFRYKDLIMSHPVIKREYNGHCPTCIQKLEGKLRITCANCGIVTIDHTAPDVCNNCYKKYPCYSLVAHHRNRAIERNLLATLTLRQWTDAVQYFNHKCAYCDRPYEVLEHYISLSFGGGTTADNCVPSCKTCNGRKGNKRPNKFEPLFPTANIARIKAYFASLTV